MHPGFEVCFHLCSLNTGASVTTWWAADHVTVTSVEPTTTGTHFFHIYMSVTSIICFYVMAFTVCSCLLFKVHDGERPVWLQDASYRSTVFRGSAWVFLCPAGLLQIRGRRCHWTLPQWLCTAGEHTTRHNSKIQSHSLTHFMSLVQRRRCNISHHDQSQWNHLPPHLKTSDIWTYLIVE